MSRERHLLKLLAPVEGEQYITADWDGSHRSFINLAFYHKEDEARADCHRSKYGSGD